VNLLLRGMTGRCTAVLAILLHVMLLMLLISEGICTVNC